MVMDGRHQKDALLGAFVIGDLDDDRQRLDHEQTAHNRQNDFMFDANRNRPQRAAQGESHC